MAIIRPDDPIRVLMSIPVASVEPTMSRADLAATLETEGVGAVTVMTGDHLERVVSERDIVRAVVSDGRVLGVVSVRDTLRVLADAWRRAGEGER
jgi:CBS domain-containing protein